MFVTFLKIISQTFFCLAFFMYISLIIKTLTDMTVTTYTNFDRQESMSAETRTEIMSIISELMDFDNTRRLENFMYGLFDGYLYSDIQIEALQLPTEIASRIMRVFDICNRYPKLQTQNN